MPATGAPPPGTGAPPAPCPAPPGPGRLGRARPLALALPLGPAAASPALKRPPAPEPELVGDAADWRRLLARTEREPAVGLDVETGGLDPHRDPLVTLQLALADRCWVVEVRRLGRALGLIRPWLAARAAGGCRTLVYNGKFDLQMLRAATGGAPWTELAVSDLWLWSLLLGCGLPQEGGHSLSAVVARWLGFDLPKQERLGDWGGPLTEGQVRYAATDAWVLVPLAAALERGARGRPGLRAEGLWRVAAVEDACVPAVAEMEFAGIGFDERYWAGVSAGLWAEAAEAGREAAALLAGAGPARGPAARSLLPGEAAAPALNLNSSAQVLAALRAAGVGVAGTSERALRGHADEPVVRALLRHKRAAKLLGSCAESLPRFVHARTGRIHAHYQQLGGGAIGRLACSGPNMQQIPRDPVFRRGFVAPPGRRLVIADLSQIELRVMCRLSGDARMTEAYRAGADLHLLTASLLTGLPVERVSRQQRQLAKAVNFGLIYSMSAAGLRAYAAASFGVRLSRAEAESFHRRFFEAYPGVAAYHRRQDVEAREAGEVRTLLGRSRRWSGGIGLPALVNTPAQGTGADLLKRAMGELRPFLAAAGAALVASVHDELVVECPAEAAEAVRAEVCAALRRAGRELLDPVPVEADAAIGGSWAEKG